MFKIMKKDKLILLSGINYVGSEISAKQCEYAKERLNIR